MRTEIANASLEPNAADLPRPRLSKGWLPAALSLLLLAGCITGPPTIDTAVRAGMTRGDLVTNFGEPLRMERLPSGAEDWYYRFAVWKQHPTSDSGTVNNFGERTTSGSVGLEFAKETEERPIHVSAEGYVIRPLPEGKVVKK